MSTNQLKQSYDLHDFVTKTKCLESLVLDADDLITNPKETLRTICKLVDLPFSEDLLTWERCDHEAPRNWKISQASMGNHRALGWYDKCFSSTGFIQPKKGQGDEADRKTLTPEEVRKIGETLPFYQALHDVCIKPWQH